MLAVQRPASFPLHIHHARVQPTKTPGLLSLSKPLPKRTQQQQRSPPKSKQQPSTSPSPAAKSHSAVLAKPFLTSTPPPRSTNRTPPSKSSSPRSRRNDRQSSPPPALVYEETVSTKAQLPAATTIFSDPFLVGEQSATATTDALTVAGNKFALPAPRKAAATIAPSLASRPSGKLAKRRQPNTATDVATPDTTPSKAVPVPVHRSDRRSSTIPISRSQPNAETLPSSFPVCDDSDDGDSANTSPVTPARSKAKSLGATSNLTHTRGYSHSYTYDFGSNDGPRTAPLFSTFASRVNDFPFQTSPTPSPRGGKNGARRHKRMPSVDNVFIMSEDDVATLRAFPGTTAPVPIPNANRQYSEAETLQMLKEGFFASSNFQNSPSPEELPPPSF